MTQSQFARFALALLLPATSAWSVSFEDAANNLAVIEGARQHAEFCERTRPGSVDLLRTWNSEVAKVRSDALSALRLNAKNSGVAASDMDDFMDRAQKLVKDQVSAKVGQNAAMCSILTRTLEHYKSLLRY